MSFFAIDASPMDVRAPPLDKLVNALAFCATTRDVPPTVRTFPTYTRSVFAIVVSELEYKSLFAIYGPLVLLIIPSEFVGTDPGGALV